jgi:hypothetical protein
VGLSLLAALPHGESSVVVVSAVHQRQPDACSFLVNASPSDRDPGAQGSYPLPSKI